ncbi:MAG: serine--tRNA ligase [Bifidobacteriaceae bacterium]|nr:serine--tRNA ligase [Bifidobacteriaceae bacterium]
MIDLKLARQEPEAVRASQRARGADPALVDAILEADRAHREALVRFESARAEQKSLGRLVSKAAGQDKRALVAQAQSLAAEVKRAGADLDRAAADLRQAALALPNLVEPGAPEGGEDKFRVIKPAGPLPDFEQAGFEPKPHDELGEALDIIDTARGAKVSGSRFYYLKGAGARLELALLGHAMDLAVELGFTPMITPTLVRPEVMGGTGFLGEHNDEVYFLPADDLYLTGTSEVALAGYHKDEILDLGAGPLRYAGWSACYRREAGSYGQDTKGIFRVHQFHKVEMFSYARPAEAAAEHLRLLQFEEQMLSDAAIPYRVIDVAAGDLGTSAARKYDCEGWIPSQGRFRELTSTSNCTTFQARRLNIRERADDGSTSPVATLNGTFATTRWLVAILENHQQADGSVVIPPALRPAMGGLSVIEPGGSAA